MLKQKNLYPHPSRSASRPARQYDKARTVLNLVAIIVSVIVLFLIIVNFVD